MRQLPDDEHVTPIGLGSNLLVRDGGIRGTVVVLHAALNTMEMRDGLVYAEAGVASPKGRAIRGEARLRRRGIPGRHSGHGRRRAGDERTAAMAARRGITSRASRC
jgi:hypothetical protein